jgi:hypothetical protein
LPANNVSRDGCRRQIDWLVINVKQRQVPVPPLVIDKFTCDKGIVEARNLCNYTLAEEGHDRFLYSGLTLPVYSQGYGSCHVKVRLSHQLLPAQQDSARTAAATAAACKASASTTSATGCAA